MSHPQDLDSQDLEVLYSAVVESVRQEDFHTITAADVAEMHGKLYKGIGPKTLIDRSIVRHLLEHLKSANSEEPDYPI